MAKRYFNWKLAIVLIIGIAVLGVTAFGLRRWQRTNRADQGLILGNKAYDEHKWSEAADNLGRYLAINQDDVPILMKYAEALLKIRPFKLGNVRQAEYAYQIVLRMDKYNSKAAMRLTELYLSQYMYMPGEAELVVLKYLDSNDNPDPELRRMLALALVGQRKISEAAAELKAIIQEHPDQISAYETLGRLTENRPDDFPDFPGKHWFNEAVNKNPSSALAYTVRAGFYRRNQDYAKTLADLERAEKLDLSDPNVELSLADEFINANILDKAEQHLKAVKSATPTDLGLWAVWAKLALKSNSKEKMLEIAETGLKELGSQPWDFMPTATELFIRSGRLDRAADCISQMNQKDIAPPQVTFLEGLLAAEKGRLFEAIKHWKESMGLGNTSVEIRLALSLVLSRVGNTQSALQHLRTLVSENPALVTGHLALARLLAQIGNWAESLRHAAAAMQILPGNLESSLLYLQAQMQLQVAGSAGEIAQTLQDLEKVAGNLPEFRLLKFRHALQQSNFTEAQALITQLKKDYPSQIEIIMAEVELLVAQDRTEEAVSILLEALEKFPQDVKPVRYYADLLYKKDDKEKCEEILKKALERIDQPVSRRTLGLRLAGFYLLWNEKDNAYELLNSLVQKLPEDIPLKSALLNCEQVIKDPERAQKIVDDIKSIEGQEGWQWRCEQTKIWLLSEDFKAHYAEIVSLLQENIQANPADQESRMLLAAAYNRSGELQLSISTYREALSHSPNNLSIIIPLIDVLSRAMEFDEVDRLLERAAAAKLYHPQLQQFQYQSHLWHGRLSSASDILQNLINNDPNNQNNRINLAFLYMYQNKFDEAEKLLAQLKAQDPNSLTIAEAQIRLNIRQNKTKEALRLCDEIVNKLNNASAYIYRARINASLKQTDKAIEDFEHAAAIEPNNVEVWITKSEFYRSIGELDKAIADIQNALSLDSSNILIQKQAISLFLGSGETEKVLQAKLLLDKALDTNPDDTDLRLLQVNLLLKEDTGPAIKEAEEKLQEITDDNPEISRAWELLGIISLDKGQAERAFETAFRGLSRTPNDRALLLLKARAEEDRSPVLAIPTLKALREMDPNNIDVVLLLAEVYIAVGELEKAENLLEAQLASYIGTLGERTIKATLMKALYKNRNSADAQRKFDSMIQSEKDNNTLINIATKLQEINDSQAQKKAEDILRMVLNNETDSIGAMFYLAILLQTSGRSDEAVPFYQQVLDLQPDNLIVINNLAWLMCEDKGMLQEALQLAQRGLKIYPNYTDLIDTRGTIYYKMGEFDKAMEDFTTCISLYPAWRPAAVGSHLHLAKTFAKLGQNDKAVEHLNQAFALNQALEPEKQIGGSELNEAQLLLKQLQEGN